MNLLNSLIVSHLNILATYVSVLRTNIFRFSNNFLFGIRLKLFQALVIVEYVKLETRISRVGIRQLALT